MPSGFIHLIIERHYTETAMVLQVQSRKNTDSFFQ